MLSINRLSARQLLVRKGRTVLTGFAIALGVASVFSLLIVGTSGSAAMERQARAHFGFADLQVLPDPMVDRGQIAKDIASIGGVEGAALENMWAQTGNLGNQKIEFEIKGIESDNKTAPRLYPLLSGRLPRKNEEVALSASFANSKGYNIGQNFPLPQKSGTRILKITGLINDGPSITSVTGGVYLNIAYSEKIAPRYNAADKSSRMIEVVLQRGESQKSVASRIKELDGVVFVRFADEMLAGSMKAVETLKALLIGVGAIALVVGMTLIYTSFAITAAEREQEIGLFKAVGANRRWARRLIYREATILGLSFSAIGLILGLSLGYAFMWVMVKTGMSTGIAASDIVVTPQDTIISLLAGIIATAFSAALPARRIGRIHPLAAICPQPKSEQVISKVRWIGLPIIIIGAVLLFMFSTASDPESMAPVGFGAALATYLGVAIFMPVIIGPLFNLLDWLSLKRIGAAGKLAAKNLGRQSLRSSRTVTSIIVGISLIFLVAFFSEAAISSGHQILKDQVKYDLVITSPDEEPFPVIPKKLLDKVKNLKVVETVTDVRLGTVKMSKLDSRGKEVGMNETDSKGLAKMLSITGILAINPDLYPKVSSLFFPKNKDSGQVWRQLQGKYILVHKDFAKTLNIEPGDKVKLTGEGGRSGEFEALTTYDTFLIGAHRNMGGYLISQENAERYLGIKDNSDTMIKFKAGTDKVAATAKIKQLIKGTSLEVKTDKQVSDMVDQLMAGPQAFLYLLFGIAVLVGLLGVINTIAIGVLERRREIGLIKAVGGTCKQVRLSIALETVLISFVGAVFGIALSTAVAVLFFKAIFGNDMLPHPFTFPFETTAILLIAVVLVSLVGAMIPIRLANRVTPIEAIRLE